MAQVPRLSKRSVSRALIGACVASMVLSMVMEATLQHQLPTPTSIQRDCLNQIVSTSRCFCLVSSWVRLQRGAVTWSNRRPKTPGIRMENCMILVWTTHQSLAYLWCLKTASPTQNSSLHTSK